MTNEEKSERCVCCRTYRKVWAFVFALLGCGLLVVAIVIPRVVDDKVQSSLQNALQIPTPRSPSDPEYYIYSNWQNNENRTANPAEYQKFYVYNITNKAALMTGSKAQVTVVGPFVYLVHRFKFNISYNSDNSIVSYQEGKWFEFVPSMSSGSESDIVTVVNLPFLAGSYVIWQASGTPLAQVFALEAACLQYNDCLFQSMSIHEALWGRYSTAIHFGNVAYFGNRLNEVFAPFVNCSTPDSCFTASYNQRNYGYGGRCVPWTSAPIKYSACSQPGTQQDGSWIPPNMNTNENTGQTDLSLLGQLYQFNGNSTLNFWNNTIPVSGNEQFQFQPRMASDGSQMLTSWDDVVMRPINLTYQYDTELLGVTLMRYRPTNHTWDGFNPTFFGPSVKGLINNTAVASVEFGVPGPVFGSRPYFTGADPLFFQDIQCSNCPSYPLYEDWANYADIEPTLGKVLRGSKRAQLTAAVGQPAIFAGSLFGQVPFSYIPVVWFEYGSEMNEDQAKEVRDALSQIKIAHGVRQAALFGGAFGGLSLLVLCGFFLFKAKEENFVNPPVTAPKRAEAQQVQGLTNADPATSSYDYAQMEGEGVVQESPRQTPSGGL